FGDCEALTDVKMSNSVTKIEDRAFSECKALTNIKIPDSVTTIGSGAFDGCEALTNIDVAEDNANYASIDGALFDKEKKILICSPESKTTLKIPHSVTKIEDVGRSLKNIYIQCKHPELLEINEDAFREIRSKNCTLHVPAGSKERYRLHPRFRKFKKIKVKHDNLIEFIKYLIGKYI
ncbi:MAG: leucine-rich repeat domain-containing protein, partial [Paludibacteraceae bacterium]|nr:leucine-rich repeat domain-containing protein [Paludibacteraceae bacterium]